MADVTKTTNDLFWGPMTVLMDSYGTAPTSEIGFKRRDGGVSITCTRDTAEHFVEEYDGPVLTRTTKRGLEVQMTLDQFLGDQLAKAMGISSTTLLLGGGSRNDDQFAVRLVGALANHRPIHLLLPKCVTMGEVKLEAQAASDSPAGIPFGLKALDGSSGMAQFMLGQTYSQAITLSTGAASYVKTSYNKDIAWLVLTPETGSTDDLDDITGSVSLGASDDGRVIRVQAASGKTIVVQHSTGVIELKGAADYTLSQAESWLDLYYDHAATAWKEITHYTAP